MEILFSLRIKNYNCIVKSVLDIGMTTHYNKWKQCYAYITSRRTGQTICWKTLIAEIWLFLTGIVFEMVTSCTNYDQVVHEIWVHGFPWIFESAVMSNQHSQVSTSDWSFKSGATSYSFCVAKEFTKVLKFLRLAVESTLQRQKGSIQG